MSIHNEKKITIILHNIRSAHNVGSIFRTADAAGVSKIYLTGYCPVPIDRFGRQRKDFIKVSLGAEKTTLWEQKKNISELIKVLKKAGNMVVAVEQGDGAKDYRKFKLTKKTVLIFGNEVRGISKQIQSLCDDKIEIKMAGNKESLNVAVTAGIILFQIVKK